MKTLLLAGILLAYLSPGFLFSDLPRNLSFARHLEFWRWDLGGLALSLVAAAALLMAFAGAGGGVLPLLRLRRADALDRLALSTGAGAGLTGTAVLGLGLAGILRPAPLYALAAALAVNAAVFFFRAGHGIAAGLAPGKRDGAPLFPALLGLAAAWCAAFLAVDLLVPEAFWDALVYHLAVPGRWLDLGAIVRVEPFFGSFPLLASADYTLALVLKGEAGARALNVLLGASLAFAVFRTGRLWLDRADARLAAFLAWSSPLLLLVSVHAGADTLCALMTVLAVHAFMRAFPRWPSGAPARQWLILSGIFCGFAWGAKPTGAAVAGVLCMLALVRPRALPWLAGTALLAVSPWLARAFLDTGDPLFPLLGFAAATPFWSAFSREAYGGELLGVRPLFGWRDILAWLPGSNPASRYAVGFIGAVPLLAAVMALLARPVRGPRAAVLAFTGALAALWLFTVPAWRFFAAGFALLPLLLVPAPRWLLLAAGLLQIAWWPAAVAEWDLPWYAAAGRQSREEFYADLHPHSSLDAFGYISRRAPGPRNRTLATGEVKGWLAPPFTRAASYFDEAPLLRMASDSRDGRRLYLRLKQAGVRYLLVNIPTFARLWLIPRFCWSGPFPGRSLDELFRNHATLVHARAFAWVYEVGRRGKGAVVPECFRLSRDPKVLTAYLCAGLATQAVGAGESGKAIGYGYAAIAANDRSGLAWAALGDALYAGGKMDAAASAYESALETGWRTSAVYRNEALALRAGGHRAAALKAIGYAVDIDPDEPLFRRERIRINMEWWEPFARKLRAIKGRK